jgi:hypothetical protein
MAMPTTSRHARGYGTTHDKMRALLMRTLILCEECTRQGHGTLGTIADHSSHWPRAEQAHAPTTSCSACPAQTQRSWRIKGRLRR